MPRWDDAQSNDCDSVLCLYSLRTTFTLRLASFDRVIFSLFSNVYYNRSVGKGITYIIALLSIFFQ